MKVRGPWWSRTFSILRTERCEKRDELFSHQVLLLARPGTGTQGRDGARDNLVKPVFASDRSEFKNVESRFCNAWNDADLKRYSRYTGSTDATYPAAYLLDSQGKVLLQLRGGHVIENELLRNLRKLINVNL